MPRYRRRPELPAVSLAQDRLWRIGGLFDAGGTLRIYTRPDGAEVVRLTVVNLSPASVDELKAGFGVGSRLGQPNVDGRGLTWSVGGRWACQHVMLAIRPYLEESSPLRTALWRLLTTGPIPPRTECDVDDCAAPVRARALCGPHLRTAQRVHLVGPATHGDRTRCPVCADWHPFGNEHQAVHLCRRCRTALTAQRGSTSELTDQP
jgi:hypothetical protein